MLTFTLQAGGHTRSYLVYLPPSYTPWRAFPLVLAFHGGEGSAWGMNRLTHLNQVAEAKSFIVVYPDGYQKHWGDGRGNTPSERDGVDDVAFIELLLETLSQQFRIDARHIYATGISNGGYFTLLLGCQLAEQIAAIAPVAASLPTNLVAQCKASPPVPMLLIHGTADMFVPAIGGELTRGVGGHILPVAATVNLWAVRNGCMATSDVENLPSTERDGTWVRRTTYRGSGPRCSVVFYNIVNGGHTWPGGWQYLPAMVVGKASTNLDASAVIWDFFQAHSA
jgi:polyhydroxybutyrate depolymerase